MSRYGFGRARAAFFHANAAGLAALLPAGLHPLESHPELGVLAVTVFDFDDTEVGAYRELVVSVMLTPWAPRGQRMPDGAVFPVLLATTTESSRTHAAERWKLPALDRCLSIEFHDAGDRSQVSIDDGGRPILRLTVGLGPQTPSHRRFQCFSVDSEQVYLAGLDFVGPLFEHEDERGVLELHDEHALGAWLKELIDDPIPFREQSMGAGEERYFDLLPHAALRRRA
jgi:hypothetical protein